MSFNAVIVIAYVLVVTLVVRTDQQEDQEIGFNDNKYHVNLRGAGTSMPEEIYNSWIAGYRTHRHQFQELNMIYDSIGSINIRDWMGNASDIIHDIEYASVTDIKDNAGTIKEDYRRFPDLQMFPTIAGAIVVGYHIEGIGSINLSMHHLVGIYNGTITHWDDPRITALNPAIKLPHEQIKPIVRDDTSGTTQIFTEALSAFSPAWNDTYGTFSEGRDASRNTLFWNASVIRYYGNTNRGMEGLILSVEYSIGYLPVSDARQARIPYADLINKQGNIVHPDVKHIHVAMNNVEFDDKFHASIVNVDAKDAYPICAYVYMIISLHSMEHCDSAIELYRYIDWFLFDAIAYEDATILDFAPLSPDVAERVKEYVLSNFTCKDQLISEQVAAEVRRELLSIQTWRIPVFASSGVAIAIILTILGYIIYLQFKINRALFRNEWKIDINDIIMYQTAANDMAKSMLSFGSDGRNKKKNETPDIRNIGSSFRTSSKLTVSSSENWTYKSIKIGRHQSKILILRETKLSSWTKLSMKTRKEFLWMRDSIHNVNVAHFYGMSASEGTLWFLTEYCSKGLLHDILQNDKYNLDINFKFSMSCDVAAGMRYLHDNGIVHGNLDSKSCYIDPKWNVKIADWGYTKLAQVVKNNLLWTRPSIIEESPDEDIFARDQLCVAPELLKGAVLLPNKHCDVYSFAILLTEIFTREDPYQQEMETRTPVQLLNDVKIRGIRPMISLPEFSEDLQKLISTCWDWMPELRLPFSKIVQKLKRIKPSKKGVLDCMMEAVEAYTRQLEERVAERTHELNATMQELETLLHKMLPPEIATKLSKGEIVAPESYEGVTVFFSDIVGFTALSSASTPMQIVDFLNDLYTTFDKVVERHDVYKVETIGDAYMVISGLPRRNGISHAGHIATMALELAIVVGDFKVRHRPSMRLQLRAGIHSGPVCAGVVGIKMPRYCLFGDTVNTASRMESTSVALKIQVSQDSHALLVEIGDYDLKLRGEVQIKGKGCMKTYWLHGKYGLQGVPPDFRRDI